MIVEQDGEGRVIGSVERDGYRSFELDAIGEGARVPVLVRVETAGQNGFRTDTIQVLRSEFSERSYARATESYWLVGVVTLVGITRTGAHFTDHSLCESIDGIILIEVVCMRWLGMWHGTVQARSEDLVTVCA